MTSDDSSVTNTTQKIAHAFFTGKEVTVTIAPGTNTVSLPKSIKGSGYALIDEGGEDLYGLGTISIVHSYSQKETVGANTRSETVDQAVERWRQALIAQGYTEAEED
jgi:hypothetical protein